MRRITLPALSLAVALASGCQDRPTEPALSPDAAGAHPARQAAAPARLERGKLKVPAVGRVSDQRFANLGGGAIDPEDYVCPVSTPITDWWLDEVLELIAGEPATFNLLYNQLLADLVPTYDALYFETDDTPQYFGYDGTFTRVVTKTERDVKRFWDIQSADIQVIGMHGSMLLDEDRVATVYREVFGVPAGLADVFASQVREAVLESDLLDGGDHALFSFNAFAYTTDGGPIPDKIVMGDAVLEGYRTLGFGDVAPQAIFAHEFAHHIQFENDYFHDPYATMGSEAERTRYTELMADAMSAYYLTHKRGATMNRKRVEQFLQVFFQIGDCAFDDGGHHGTPNQRMAAARFGFQVADGAQKQGHILTAEQFHALFVAAYPGIVAPDAR